MGLAAGWVESEERAPFAVSIGCPGMVEIVEQHALDGGQCLPEVAAITLQVGEQDASGGGGDFGQETLGSRGLPPIDERRRCCHSQWLRERVSPGATNKSLESRRFVWTGPQALEDRERLRRCRAVGFAHTEEPLQGVRVPRSIPFDGEGRGGATGVRGRPRPAWLETEPS